MKGHREQILRIIIKFPGKHSGIIPGCLFILTKHHIQEVDMDMNRY